MVSRADESFHPPQPPPAAAATSLPAAAEREFEVLLPVFLRVTVRAADDLAAEVLAVEAVRAMPPVCPHLPCPGGSTSPLA